MDRIPVPYIFCITDPILKIVHTQDHFKVATCKTDLKLRFCSKKKQNNFLISQPKHQQTVLVQLVNFDQIVCVAKHTDLYILDTVTKQLRTLVKSA